MQVETLTKKGQLRDWLWDSVKDGATYFAVDVETSGLSRTDKIVSCAVTGPDENFVAFFGPELISELLEAPKGSVYIMHNASFDLKMLAWHGVRLHDHFEYVDTLVYAHLNDENSSHSLGDLVELYYADPFKKEFWEKYDVKKVLEIPEEELRQYNSKDVHYTLRLYHLLRDLLREDGVPESLVIHVHSLQSSLLETEINGILVDKEYLLNLAVNLKTRITELLPRMREMVKDEIELIECDEWIKQIDKRKTPKGRAAVPKPEFTFTSAKQLQALLYDKIGLEKQYNEKTKQVSVDWDSLEKLKDKHPIVAAIQEYRELEKVYGTYIMGITDKIVGGRIYPSFNCAGTATGRISHSNPNMANMPRDGGIRGMFIPDPGYVFVSADYNSLEVFIEAHFTKDKNLLRLVNEGISKHDLTASEVGIDRNTAKTTNFLAQYHGTAFKLCKVLGCSLVKAQEILDKYWAAYGGCKALKAETDAKVVAGEPIINPFGRRRRFKAGPRKEWDGDLRQAYNALIQGTGSDCLSWSFYTVDEELKKRGWGRSLFGVHDEAILHVKKEFAKDASEMLVNIMVEAGKVAGLSVQLKAETCIHEVRWDD